MLKHTTDRNESERISESYVPALKGVIISIIVTSIVLGAGYFIRQNIKAKTPGSVDFAAVAQNTNCDANCVQTIAGAVNACKGQLDIIENISVVVREFSSYRGDNFTETKYNVDARCIDSKVITASWVVYGIKTTTKQ